jgi:hypothetical protein
MNTPFSWIAVDQQGSVLVILCVASLALMKMLSTIGIELTIKSQNIPLGIINLELPWSPKRAASIVKVWREQDLIEKAVQQTKLDFVLLLIYPATVSLACTMLVGSGEGLTATIGVVLSWAVLFCTPLDAFENVMILRMLSGSCDSPIPQLTTFAAGLKFFLMVVIVCYMLFMVALKILPVLHLN